MMNILIYLSLILANESTECSLRKNSNVSFELKYKNLTAEVETVNSDTKIESCKLWKEFPNLLLVEINLGSSGTTAKTNETDLFVYDISKNNLDLKYQTTIREDVGRKDAKTGKMRTSSIHHNVEPIRHNNKPALRLKEESKIVPLD